MSYLALATDRFDEMLRFYGEALKFTKLEYWDRPNGRGQRFDLAGLKLEILDNARERQPLCLGASGDRVHVVIEVEDISQARQQLPIETPLPAHTSWGASWFQVRDPDGTPVTFLEWDKSEGRAQ